MSRHRLPDQVPPPTLQADAPTAGWAAWVRQQWATVRVTHVETNPLRADVPRHVRLRANVHLGSLAPADVLVEATADRAKTATRLASLQSYGNGIYVFEGVLPPHAFKEGHPLIVRVRPGASHDAFSGLGEIARAFEVRRQVDEGPFQER